jgi:hypothetical protein
MVDKSGKTTSKDAHGLLFGFLNTKHEHLEEYSHDHRAYVYIKWTHNFSTFPVGIFP